MDLRLFQSGLLDFYDRGGVVFSALNFRTDGRWVEAYPSLRVVS